MKESNFYKYAAILLLVINIGMMAFFFSRKPPRHGPHGGRPPMEGGEQKFQEETMKMLHLDEGQKAAFLNLAEQHHEQMGAINQQQKELLTTGFGSFLDTTKMAQFIQDLRGFEVLEGKKIATTFQHFRDVKAMLQTEQLPYFEKFLEGARRHLLGDRKGEPKDF